MFGVHESEPQNELEYLARAAQGGHWGFAVSALNIAGTSLLTSDLPSFMARVWTLNLLAMRYQQGALSSPASQFGTPDGQTDGNDTFCRLDYGVDGAMESVIFDYPKRGATLQFHGASFRLYVDFQVTGITPGGSSPRAPLIGGFVTPAGRGNSSQDALPSVTLTTGVLTFLTATAIAQTVAVPNRARGYRLMHQTNVAGQVFVRQMSGGPSTSPVSIDFSAGDPAGPQPILIEQGAGVTYMFPFRENWVPLARQAELLEITVTPGAITNATLRVQFLLDIG